VTFYDTIVYNLRTGFTPSNVGGFSSITANDNLLVDWSTNYAISADIQQVTVTLRSYIDAVLLNERVINLGQAGVQTVITGLGSFPINAGQVITLEVEVNKVCNLTTYYSNTGLSEVA
jgi:hypothetical protein